MNSSFRYHAFDVNIQIAKGILGDDAEDNRWWNVNRGLTLSVHSSFKLFVFLLITLVRSFVSSAAPLWHDLHRLLAYLDFPSYAIPLPRCFDGFHILPPIHWNRLLILTIYRGDLFLWEHYLVPPQEPLNSKQGMVFEGLHVLWYALREITMH